MKSLLFCLLRLVDIAQYNQIFVYTHNGYTRNIVVTKSMLFKLNVGSKNATVSWLQKLFTITSQIHNMN